MTLPVNITSAGGLLAAGAIHPLATVNAALNATATLLLIAGYVLIKRRRERAHKWVMLSAFGVSIVFLTCYLIYHARVGHVPFTGVGLIRPIYLGLLLSHVLLAVTVPVLTIRTIYLGLTDQRARHRRWARWTYPIWLYVSVTGVVIYLLLYHVYGARRWRSDEAPRSTDVLRSSRNITK